MTTPTPETPSLSELKRLREAAMPYMPTSTLYSLEQTGFGRASAFIAYAANHSVTIAESLERENVELREALKTLGHSHTCECGICSLLAKYKGK